MFPVEPSAAIEAQIQASAKLTRSASFDQWFGKMTAVAVELPESVFSALRYSSG
jgi:hypothetical protein